MTSRLIVFHTVRSVALLLRGLAVLFDVVRVLTLALDSGVKGIYTACNTGSLRLKNTKFASHEWKFQGKSPATTDVKAPWQVRMNAVGRACLNGLNLSVGYVIECIEMIFGYYPQHVMPKTKPIELQHIKPTSPTRPALSSTRSLPLPGPASPQSPSTSFVLKQARIVQLRQKIAAEKARKSALNGTQSLNISFWASPRQPRFAAVSAGYSPLSTPTSAHQSFFYGVDDTGDDWAYRRGL
ncbi:hypothetical protein OIV83_005120 [Microbotryomycetes sp. JL201]|nr:hypothetical protein OIV83_005120 [Microbotryomycetes sp. JL201]